MATVDQAEHRESQLLNESELSFHINNHRSSSYENLAVAAGGGGGTGEDHLSQQQRIYLTSPNLRTEDHDNYNHHGRVDTLNSFDHVMTAPETSHHSNSRKGFLQMLIASGCISGSALLIKKVENDQISVFELIFYRSLFIILILFLMYKIAEKRAQHRNNTDPNDDTNYEHEMQLLQVSMQIDESLEHQTAGITTAGGVGSAAALGVHASHHEQQQQQQINSSSNNNNKDNNGNESITFVRLKERKFVQIYSVLNAIIMFSFFYGVKQMPLFEAISLQNCSLLFSGLLGFIAFQSKQSFSNIVSKREIASAIMIAVGVYLISLTAPFKATIVCVVGGSVTSAMIQLIVRKYATKTAFMTLLFYSSFVQLIISPLLVYAYSSFTAISLKDIAFVALMALLQIIGTSYLQKSFLSFADGRFVNFHVPLSIFFTIILGHLLLDEAIEKTPLIGSMFIVCSSVFIILSAKN